MIAWVLLGEFASAIETLVTAISLIKQSKIASDDRCKILISSLQDTLHGIESKSYGSKYVVFIPNLVLTGNSASILILLLS